MIFFFFKSLGSAYFNALERCWKTWYQSIDYLLPAEQPDADTEKKLRPATGQHTPSQFAHPSERTDTSRLGASLTNEWMNEWMFHPGNKWAGGSSHPVYRYLFSMLRTRCEVKGSDGRGEER